MGTFIKESAKPSLAIARPYSIERPLTASATRIKVNDKEDAEALKRRKATQKWQEEAWAYVDAIGEIKYAFNVFSNILSRIRIHAAFVENDDAIPTPIRNSEASDKAKNEADKLMRRVFGGGQQAAILRKAAYNILVTGECYLINIRSDESGTFKEQWRIVSTDELVPLDGGFGLKTRADAKANEIQPLPGSTFMGRIWRQHPRYSDEPDSSMKALLEVCNELLLLSRTVRATARSRLNAGALFVPDEFSVSQDVPTDELSEDLEAYIDEDKDEFEEQLIQAMTTPITSEDSAAAVVPLLIRGPSELGEKINLIKFERAFDPQLTNRADRALERILQGLDMPKEMITGLANIKYSNAIQINESLYTGHIEPLVLMLCDLFRTIYLEPALILAGVDAEEVEKIVIWYDPSGITTAPDKSNAANVGFDKGVLSGSAWRTANGFDDADAPTPMEMMTREALKRGPMTPELTDTIFRDYVPELLKATRENTLANSVAPVPDDVQQLLGGEPTAPPNDPAAAPAEPTAETPPSGEGGGPPPPELVP